MRILFVEDHRVFAETVVAQFLSDHEVEIAESVATARNAVMTGPAFDVVLVDYDLPDGKGTEVVRQLRAMRFRGALSRSPQRTKATWSYARPGHTRFARRPSFIGSRSRWNSGSPGRAPADSGDRQSGLLASVDLSRRSPQNSEFYDDSSRQPLPSSGW
jgi:hypothetical protein